MTDDPDFFAWLDGELSPEAAASMEARVAGDPELRRLASEHRELQARLSAAFAPIAAAPVPASLAERVRVPAADVIDLSARRQTRDNRRSAFRVGWPQSMAVAASLALGLLLGSQIVGREAGIVGQASGTLVATGDLDRALSRELASAPAAGAPRIALTFRSKEGNICRSFSGGAGTGLACRRGDDWQLEALYPNAPEQSGDYRMAAGADTRILDLVDAKLAGEPFDEAQERKARDSGWR